MSGEAKHDGCDCAELCEMGPTCPGGGLAGLPGSGCWRGSPEQQDVVAKLSKILTEWDHHD